MFSQKPRLWLTLTFCLLTVALLFLVLSAGESQGNTITVDDDGEGDYVSIQDAVDNATKGDTVRVWEGTYYENVVVNKTVSLIGNGSAVTAINGGGVGVVVRVEADWCNVSGFNLTKGRYGIYIDGSNSNSISNNTIRPQNNKCIFIGKSERNSILNNIIEGCIWVENSNSSIISNNFIHDSDYGIFLQNSNSNTIINNTIQESRNSGIRITESSLNSLSQNTIQSDAKSAIYLWKSESHSLYSNILNNEITLRGESLSHWNTHDIPDNNSVNGKAIHYLKNTENTSVPQGVAVVILANCTNISMEKLNLSNPTERVLIGFSSHISISNSTFSGNKKDSITLYRSSFCTISNNLIQDNAHDGIFLEDSEMNHITGNTIQNCGNHGITLYSESNSKYLSNNTISNNIIQNNDYCGIFVRGSESDMFLTNIIQKNDENGIHFINSPFETISVNTIQDNGKYGINGETFFGSSDSSIISDNLIRGNEKIGIRLESHSNTLVNNTIQSNEDFGINLHGDLNTISKNRILDNDIGMFLGGDSNFISNNLFQNNKDRGIWMKSTNLNVISNNTIAWCEIGILVEGSSQNNSAYHNNILNSTDHGINAVDNNDHNFNATNNWWGDNTGPYHPELNPNGTGDEVTDFVVFSPWTLENRKPQITGEDRLTALEDQPYLVDYNATDEDDDPLAWSLSSNASFLTINTTTGLLSGTPFQEDVGEYWVNVTVSDGELFDYHNFTLTVLEVNEKPLITATDLTQVDEDAFYQQHYLAVDEEGDELVWELKTNADFLNLEPSTGNLTGSPTQEDVGSYWVNVTVSDGELFDYHNFTLTVIEVNDPPILSITSPANDSTVKEELKLEGMVQDPDSAIEKVELQINSGGWIQALGTNEWRFTIDTLSLVNGQHNITVRVSDGEFTAHKSISITVDNPIPEPEKPDLEVNEEDIKITGPNKVGEENTVTITIHNVGDEDGRVTVLVYLDEVNNNSLILGQTLDVPKGGSATSSTANWLLEEAGEHTVIVVLEDKSTVPEENTDNNRAETTITVEKEEEKKDDDSPGFGLVGAVLGVVLVTGWRRRRAE